MKRFWDKVRKSESCWDWIASVDRIGYGSFGFKGKTEKAHRVSFLLCKGDIPNGSCVLHKCDNRKCVNPEHLYLGDMKRNMKDKMERRRHHFQKVTHCPKGHPYSGDNLYLRQAKSGTSRSCKTCHREHQKEYMKRKQEVMSV